MTAPAEWLLSHDDYIALLGAAMTGEPLPAAEVVAITTRAKPIDPEPQEEAA